MESSIYGLKVLTKKVFLLLLFVGLTDISIKDVLASTMISWTSRASMATERFALDAVTAPNGKIYAIGGQGGFGLDNVEEYDPAIDSWSNRANMPTPRRYLGLAIAPSGKIYAIGGESCGSLAVCATVEEYDPLSDTWTPRAEMPTARRGLGAVTATNGKIYAVGGSLGTAPYFNKTEEYDPSTDTWSVKANMPTAREDLEVAAAPNGKIYAIGGRSFSQNPASTVEEYDPATNVWTSRANMPVPVVGFAAVTAPNGNIYVIGGRSGAFGVSRVQEYDPSTDSWRLLTDLPSPRWWLGGAVTSSGKLYAMGGFNANGTATLNTMVEGVITTTNDTPNVAISGSNTTNEGSVFSKNGSFSDDSTSWTATVNYGDGSGTVPLTLSGTSFSLSHVYKDNGSYLVMVSVTDNEGETGEGTVAVTVNNVVPTVGTVSAIVNPVQINNATTLSAPFTDAGVLDTHIASWNWGDGNITTGTVSETNGSGTVSDSHTYIASGVYTVSLTLTDKDGGVKTTDYQYVSVYNPTAQGLFNGARIFTSPTGALTQDLLATGQVHFGINARYSQGAATGNVKMNFKDANFSFDSDTITLLVLANDKATLRGTGKVNGQGNYTFLATGIDGQATGGNTIRLQIKDAFGNVVYDTQPGASDITDPTTSVTGRIIVH